jgi:hypothetical protein
LVSFGLADAATTSLFCYFAETSLLALANFYAGLSGVLNHRISDYWSFTVL